MTSKKEFFYNLPTELIAQHPLSKRDDSRLMVLASNHFYPIDNFFSDLPNWLKAGDCLVLNNTRVIPARLLGHKLNSNIECEVLLLSRKEEDVWECLVRPGRRLKIGSKIIFQQGRLIAEIIEIIAGGNRLIRFVYDGIWEEILEEAGRLPLPPYITEEQEDINRYQTIYAQKDGSAAAPTAGLHFTKSLLDRLDRNKVNIVRLTLHVGLGTFRPVKEESIEKHMMHSEYYELSQQSADLINLTKEQGGRVFAVGTTSCRVLETVAKADGRVTAQKGWTDIFIYPGYSFKVIDALITNFHLPESTLLMLVAAFGGKERVLNAYKHAIFKSYRFFSFGDAMLVFPPESLVQNGEDRE